MKKLKVICVFLTAFLVSQMLTACSKSSVDSVDVNYAQAYVQKTETVYQEPKLKPLDAPKVLSVGSTLMWTEDTDAVAYEIYRNGELLTTTTETHYSVNETEERSKYNIVSVHSDPKGNSKKSTDMVVYKQSGFSEDETMVIELANNSYTVPSSIRYVKVSGSASSACIAIADRSTDLMIALEDVIMTSPEGKSCIMTSDGTYDLESKKFGVTIVVKGTNMLNGSDYTVVPDRPGNNSGQAGYKGGNGGNGGNGIALPAVAFVGDGSLTLKGGNGGQGGSGSNTTFFAAVVFKKAGNGGNGGNGGHGIACSYMVVTMDNNGALYTCGGSGGKGGAPGVEQNAINNFVDYVSGSKKDSYGKNGSDGAGSTGTVKQYSGIYVT